MKVRKDGILQVTAAGTLHDCGWPPSDRLVGGNEVKAAKGVKVRRHGTSEVTAARTLHDCVWPL